LPFFNKIRKALIPAEGLKRYLFYAVGEILLVMIGILLALEVTNWNEEQKEQETEKSMLRSILKGLVKDSADLEFNKAVHLESLNSQKIVIKWIEGTAPFHDSLKRHISLSFRYTGFISVDEPYENLKREGTRLIRNEGLREEISNLYDLRYDLYGVLENQYIQFINNAMKTTNQDFFDQSNPIVYNPPDYKGEMTPLDPQKLRTDKRFSYQLKTISALNEMFIFYSQVKTQEKCGKVRSMLRQELERV
jgi:hypothetical protein